MEPMRVGQRVSPVDVSVAAPMTAPLSSARTTTTPRATVVDAMLAGVILSAAFAVDPDGLRPFTSLRWLLVSTLTVLVALALRRSGRPHDASIGLPSWFLAIGSALLISMVVAAALVGDQATAWLGHPQRHLGVLAWIVFGTAALVGAALAGAPGHARLLAVSAAVTAVLTGVSAAADLLGWSPVGTSFAGGRIGGLLGQPTSLGALAVLLLPLATTAPIATRWRMLTGAGLALALVGSQTRGAVVGLVAVGAVSIPAILPRFRQRALWLLAVPVVLLATPAGGRLLDSADSSRVDDWRLGAAVIADHPVLGVGPEGYRIAVIDQLDADYVDQHGRDVVVDRAHSSPLDVAASGGVLAGIAYLALVGAVVVATWRLQRRAPWSVPASAGAGAVGFLVAGFFAFPTPAIDTVAWLFAGLAVAAAFPTAAAATDGAGWRRRIPVALMAVLAGIALSAGTTDMLADRWLAEAQDHRSNGRIEDAVASADRATSLRPDLIDGWYVAAQTAAAGPTILDLDAAIDRAESGLRRSPEDPALRALHARLVTERAIRSGLDVDRAQAAATVESLLADDPTNIDARELLATLEEAP